MKWLTFDVWDLAKLRGVVWFGLLLASPAFAAQEVPKRVYLTYALEKGGQLIAHTEESYIQTGSQYRIQSVTTGQGVYALLGERKSLSEGTLSKAGLQPSHFESLQTKQKSKALINDFDWKQKLLRMQVKGEVKQEPLEVGAQDLLSVMYQFMHTPPRGKQVLVPVTTGKKLKRQHFKVSEETLTYTTQAGPFHVVKLSEVGEHADEKIIYLAKDQHYLPVKIIMQEDGATLEQTLVSIKIE